MLFLIFAFVTKNYSMYSTVQLSVTVQLEVFKGVVAVKKRKTELVIQ